MGGRRMKVSVVFSLLRHAHNSHLWTHPHDYTSFWLLWFILGVIKMNFEI